MPVASKKTSKQKAVPKAAVMPVIAANKNSLSSKSTLTTTTLGIIFFLFVVACGLLVLTNSLNVSRYRPKPIIDLNLNKNVNVAAFSSVDDFKTYLAQASDLRNQGFNGGLGTFKSAPMMAREATTNADTATGSGGAVQLDRFSETNVQVAGVDEPDIVKTDGQNIFFSPEPYLGIYRDIMPVDVMIGNGASAKMMPPIYQNQITAIIKALPAAEAEQIAKLEKTGNLLLKNNVLVIFAGQEIIAYDVTDATKPLKKWSYQLAEDYYLQTARLLGDEIYLLTQSYINEYQPCPLKPFISDNTDLQIACSDIYHPIMPTAIDTNFSALKLNINSGEIKNKVSFVGGSGQAILYMSADNLFVTYDQPVDMFTVSYKFMSEKMSDLIPATALDKIIKLNNYDISQSSKLTELYNILNKWQASLTKDTRLQFDTEMQNRLQDYVKANQRQLSSTGIIKISLDNLSVVANGAVPGQLLNQFSLDEYKGNLRLATNIGSNWWLWNVGMDGNSSVNDVYVLDKNLNISGSIQDLGLGERIYSARFIADRGYLVTFKQIDPFYVLDLSDPNNPQKKGELKIPGFSSYLHPLGENMILGVGQEDSKVKLSYFDVTDAANPKEVDKYLLDEYWTEVSNNHHAFLADTKHQIFFIPGGQGAYIFSYQDQVLTLKKAVDMNNVKRALYINDNLYLLASDQVKILNENTWETIQDFSLNKD